MTNIKDQLERLREQENAKAFLNRPSLRLEKQKHTSLSDWCMEQCSATPMGRRFEMEADLFLSMVLGADAK